MKSTSTPASQLRQSFLEWYHVTTFGQILQTIEASYLQSALKLTFNQKTLQVGRLGSEGLYIDNDFIGDFTVVDEGAGRVCGRIVSALAGELPIASSSIDTLILPHILEFESNRHQVLQEVERVLKPEGRLFILGLNPWSLHGIVQYLPRKVSFWRGNFVSSHRLLDWLSLLKFDAELSAAFSISSNRVLGKPATFSARSSAALSFAYAVKAVKRRYTLIPIEPSWLHVPSLAAGHMFEKTLLAGELDP
jgi:SAM-dependent methyltransferase